MDEVKDPLVDDTLEGTKVVSSVSDLIINVPKANEGNNIDVNTETDNDDENIDSIDLDIEEPEEPVVEETKLELNPNLFDANGVMIADVRQHLLQIAKEFFSQTSIPYNDYKNQILDIRLVGSNAGYNYTYNSDIDLHIVVDLYAIADSCPELLADLFNLEKSKFNMSYDITISEIPVEIYVEDVKASTKSNGIYSILKNDWIKKPDVNEYKDDHVILTDDDEVAQIIDQINNLIDNNTSAKSIQDELNNLYMVRKTSLETGEPKGNQIFKTLRSVGLIDKLKQAYYDKKSKELSMESMHKKFVKLMDEDYYDYLDDGDYNSGYITYDDYYDDYQDDLSEQEFKDALYFALDYFEDGIEYNDDDSLFTSDLQYQCYLDLINMDEADFYNEYNDELGEIRE